MNPFDRLNLKLEKLDIQIQLLKDKRKQLYAEKQKFCIHENIEPGPDGTYRFSSTPEYICIDCDRPLSMVQYQYIQYRRYLIEVGMDERTVREMDDQELVLHLQKIGYFEFQQVQ